MAQCYLNGRFLPLEQARISPLDRGFLFGDGVYEVIPVYRRRLFCRQRHLARLQASLEKIRLPFEVETLLAPIQRLVDEAAESEQTLYLQITRGEMSPRRLAIPPACEPTVFIMTQARPAVPADKLAGVRCHRVTDIRWARCDIKSTSLLGAALLAPAADSEEEEVMIIRDGLLSEGSSSNFILVKDGGLLVPLADNRMLPGITYRMVTEIAATCGRQVIARDIHADEIAAADEIWLASSTREMLPVVRLNDQPVASGKPGAVFRQVHAAWRAYIDGSDWFDE